MKSLKFYPLCLVPFLLLPLALWLGHLNDSRFFLGLSSSFWAGVGISVSIVCGSLFVALAVLHLLSTRAAPGGDYE
jgi:hypothetical protein